MARFLADENVPLPLVEELVRLGYDVLRVQELEPSALGMDDADVFRRGIALGRSVLTENAWDFIRLHSQDEDHQGIVTFTRDPDMPALATRIHEKVRQEPDLSRRLVRVTRPSFGLGPGCVITRRRKNESK